MPFLALDASAANLATVRLPCPVELRAVALGPRQGEAELFGWGGAISVLGEGQRVSSEPLEGNERDDVDMSGAISYVYILYVCVCMCKYIYIYQSWKGVE